MSAWYNQRERAFRAMLKQWGSVLTYNGMEAECLADPIEALSKTERTSIMPVKPAKFSVLRAEFVRLGIKMRSIVESAGSKFELFSITDDPAEPFVDFRCVLKL